MFSSRNSPNLVLGLIPILYGRKLSSFPQISAALLSKASLGDDNGLAQRNLYVYGIIHVWYIYILCMCINISDVCILYIYIYISTHTYICIYIWYDIWCMICDIWYMIYDILYMIYDIWHMIYYILYMVYDICYIMHVECTSYMLIYILCTDVCSSLCSAEQNLCMYNILHLHFVCNLMV